MSAKFEFSLKESLEKFNKDIDDLADAVQEELNQALSDVAYAAHAHIIAQAQSQLHSTRQDYLKGVEFLQMGDNDYLITLIGTWPNMLEDGFPSYNQTEKLLKSQKIVEVGSRTGLPWVQIGQEGQKYAHVPMQRQPFAAGAGAAGDLAKSIQAMTATNARGRKQKITSVFKDAGGLPIEGKVAIGRSDNPNLDGLVKYQKVYENPTSGKKTAQGIYVNYRTISENGNDWIHPGFTGIHAWDEAEKYVEQQINQILRTILGN